MSKLADRMPALADPHSRLELTINKMDNLVQDGRVNLSELHDVLVAETRQYPINENLIEDEGRKAVATQMISQLTAQRTISIDRQTKAPVYQTAFGFSGNWFKVGGQLVAPEAMTLADFDEMISRIGKRIDNATIDRDVWVNFRDRARPGLEAGQNLVEQFEAGTLDLFPAEAGPPIESGENGTGNENGAS